MEKFRPLYPEYLILNARLPHINDPKEAPWTSYLLHATHNNRMEDHRFDEEDVGQGQTDQD